MYEVGEIVNGKVKPNGIKNFGVFVELPDGEVGLVHISQVSNDYVENINNYLCEGQEVKVKLLDYKEVDGKKKIALSIKQANPNTYSDNSNVNNNGSNTTRYSNGGNGGNNYTNNSRPYNKKKEWKDKPNFNKNDGPNSNSLDDMIAKFKKESDEKISDLNQRLDGF